LATANTINSEITKTIDWLAVNILSMNAAKIIIFYTKQNKLRNI